MRDFVYSSQPSRVVFGAGSIAHLPREVEQLGARRVLVLSTAAQAALAAAVAERLGPRSAGIFAGAVTHVPVEAARAACDEALRLNADCAVAVGGGSTERALGVTGGGGTAAAALFDLALRIGAPVALRDIGMKAADLDVAADLAVRNPYWNPSRTCCL